MHVCAGPHDPHANYCNYYGYAANSTVIFIIYFWFEDFASGLLLIPTYIWKTAPAIMPRNRNIAEPIISPDSLLIILWYWLLLFM